MVKVLFVCLGNICRSPMAEAVFRDKVRKEGLDQLIKIDSAGLGSWHTGEPPHSGTQRILEKNSISFEGLKARQIKPTDLEEYDYIIAMDDENIEGIQRIKTENPKAYVAKLMDFVDDAKEENVPDPYYTGNFEYVYSLVTEGCNQLLEKVKADLAGGAKA